MVFYFFLKGIFYVLIITLSILYIFTITKLEKIKLVFINRNTDEVFSEIITEGHPYWRLSEEEFLDLLNRSDIVLEI